MINDGWLTVGDLIELLKQVPSDYMVMAEHQCRYDSGVTQGVAIDQIIVHPTSHITFTANKPTDEGFSLSNGVTLREYLERDIWRKT